MTEYCGAWELTLDESRARLSRGLAGLARLPRRAAGLLLRQSPHRAGAPVKED